MSRWLNELWSFSVLGCIPWMRGMLRGGWARVVESLQRFGDIVGHGEIDGALIIVPFEVNSAKDGAIPVDSERVLFLEAVDEM